MTSRKMEEDEGGRGILQIMALGAFGMARKRMKETIKTESKNQKAEKR